MPETYDADTGGSMRFNDPAVLEDPKLMVDEGDFEEGEGEDIDEIFKDEKDLLVDEEIDTRLNLDEEEEEEDSEVVGFGNEDRDWANEDAEF